MKKKFLSSLLALVLTIGATLTGCGAAGSEETKADTTNQAATEAAAEESYEGVVVRIGEQPTGLWFTLADQRGLFDDLKAKGVTFEYSNFINGPGMNEAFAGGQLDLGLIGTFPAISGVASGYGYKVVARIAGGEQTSPLIANPNSGITSIEDLKGKNVGTYIGGTWQFVLLKYLGQVGLNETDINLFNTAADTATALRSGEIDAAVLGVDTALTLIDEGSAVLISDTPGTDSPTGVIAANAFAAEHPQLLSDILAVLAPLSTWVKENPAEYAAFMAEKAGANAEILTQVVAKYDLDNTAVSDALKQHLSDLLQFAKDNALLSNYDVEATDLYDDSFIK